MSAMHRSFLSSFQRFETGWKSEYLKNYFQPYWLISSVARKLKQDDTRSHLFISICTRVSFCCFYFHEGPSDSHQTHFSRRAMLLRLDHFFKELFSFTGLYSDANWVFLLEQKSKNSCKMKRESVGEEFNSAKGF